MKRHTTVSEVDIGSPDRTRLLGDPPSQARRASDDAVAASAVSC